MPDMPERIEAKRVKYHRNGIGGAGFYTVEFSFLDDDQNYRDMVATIFPEGEEDTPPYYAVLDVSDFAYRWRGDWFINALWDVIKDHRGKEETLSEIHS